jgi:hypothetical protein
MVLNTVGSITGLSCRCMHDDVRGPRPRVAIYWHARAKRTLVRLRDRMSYGLQTQAHTISNPNKMHQCGHKHALKEKHHHFRCSICYFNLLDRANLQIRSHRIFEYWNGKVSFYFHQIHHKCKMYLGVRTELQGHYAPKFSHAHIHVRYLKVKHDDLRTRSMRVRLGPSIRGCCDKRVTMFNTRVGIHDVLFAFVY